MEDARRIVMRRVPIHVVPNAPPHAMVNVMEVAEMVAMTVGVHVHRHVEVDVKIQLMDQLIFSHLDVVTVTLHVQLQIRPILHPHPRAHRHVPQNVMGQLLG